MSELQLPSGVYVSETVGRDRAASLAGSIREYEMTVAFLQERMSALELALEDRNWQLMQVRSEQEFSRDGLRNITALVRLMYVKNPLIQRGVNVQRDYVFGQGISVRGESKAVNDVIQKFWNDTLNKAELTSYQALRDKEVMLNLDSNLFFVFFVNQSSGRVRVRTIPFAQIERVICNPEDAKEPWYYERNWLEQRVDEYSGQIISKNRHAYYPDWRYQPNVKPPTIGNVPVHWSTPVYHVKVGGFGEMAFGISEQYAALDWARAYKEFLEDWATIVRAYSRFAFQLTTNGNKLAAKAKMASTLGSGGYTETNPSPAAGSTFIGGPYQRLEPIRTNGATVSAEDGRRLLLMVASVQGLPETFYGDSQAGTLATARSLDRPTELKFVARQALWKDVLGNIFDYVIMQAVRAGVLTGKVTEEDDGTPDVTVYGNDGLQSTAIAVRFPPVLEHDVAAAVNAIVAAGTLQNYTKAGTIDDRTLSRMLLTALGETDIETVMDALYGDAAQPKPNPELAQAEAQFMSVVNELREAMDNLGRRHYGEEI